MAFLHLPPIRWLTSFYNPPRHFNSELSMEVEKTGQGGLSSRPVFILREF
jgi:hypothetical protein